MSLSRKQRSTQKPGPVTARRRAAVPVVQQAMIAEVRELILTDRLQIAQAVNARLTILHWQIGNRIHREILRQKRADYGAEIVSALSRELEAEFGRGFGRRNLFSMIRFAKVFPDLEIVQSLIAQLGWQNRYAYPLCSGFHDRATVSSLLTQSRARQRKRAGKDDSSQSRGQSGSQSHSTPKLVVSSPDTRKPGPGTPLGVPCAV